MGKETYIQDPQYLLENGHDMSDYKLKPFSSLSEEEQYMLSDPSKVEPQVIHSAGHEYAHWKENPPIAFGLDVIPEGNARAKTYIRRFDPAAAAAGSVYEAATVPDVNKRGDGGDRTMIFQYALSRGRDPQNEFLKAYKKAESNFKQIPPEQIELMSIAIAYLKRVGSPMLHRLDSFAEKLVNKEIIIFDDRRLSPAS